MAQLPHELEARRVFALLKPLCTQLLELPSSKPDFCSSVLQSLAQALREVPADGLQVCMDYILFPLQLLLDAAVSCRSSTPMPMDLWTTQKVGQSRLAVSDRIAEGVLSCLKELLQRCPMKSASQMKLLLKKLTAAAMLPPDEASEEFRHGTVKCLKAMLLALIPCDKLLCSCNLSTVPPYIITGQGSLKLNCNYVHNKMETDIKAATEEVAESDEECPIACLQSKDMAAAIGHLLSLLLQIADTEALRGVLGSANLRIDAFSTLRALLLKVNSADALAFFLPGVASKLAKAIYSSRVSKEYSLGFPSQPSYPAGAAGISGAVEEGLRGFAELLVLVLADARNAYAIKEENMNQNSFISTADNSSLAQKEPESVEQALVTLRGFFVKNRAGLDSSCRSVDADTHDSHAKIEGGSSYSSDNGALSRDKPEGVINFHIERDEMWLGQTAARVTALLVHVFPPMCAHPAPSVRLALVDSAAILLLSCRHSLMGCKVTLLESLLAMACDDWPHVASAACSYLGFLSVQLSKVNPYFPDLKDDIKKVLSRLIDKLPKAVFSADEGVAVLLSRQLAAAMCFSGPDNVFQCLFHSPAAIVRFVTAMSQCLSVNSAFSGPIEHINSSKVHSLGYVHGISELSASKKDEESSEQSLTVNPVSGTCNGKNLLANTNLDKPRRASSSTQQLPRMPPWLAQNDRSKLYCTLSSVLRLSGLSCVSGCGGETPLLGLVETFLIPLRKLSSQLSISDTKGDLHTLLGGGQLQRAASTTACLLNEIIYGASGCWIEKIDSLFVGFKDMEKKVKSEQEFSELLCSTMQNQTNAFTTFLDQWKGLKGRQPCKILIDCVGHILHDYMSPEIWELPVDMPPGLPGQASFPTYVSSYDLRDNVTLQQVIVEGIGSFAVSLGKSFEEHGFLGSVLYLLLEKLGSMNYAVSSSADLALHAIPSHCGYPSVKALVMANADHILDSLCRQLRHLSLHPGASDMLVAVLRYTGAAPDLLPLLEEPMRSISLELEIPARQEHPRNTIPMMRALREIVLAAKSEGSSMLLQTSESANLYLMSTEKAAGKRIELPEDCDSPLFVSDDKGKNHEADDTTVERLRVLEEAFFKLKERTRCRQALEKVVITCLNVCSPLMASKDRQTCLLALDIVEDGVRTLSSMDKIARYEKEERGAITSLVDHDAEAVALDDEPPRLLPTMHRVWPHLVSSLKQSYPAVLIKCLKVIASVISSCGGDFFIRRFQKDAVPHILGLLCGGTVLTKQQGPKQSLLGRNMPFPRREDTFSAQEERSPVSLLKVQEAVLKCIKDIANDSNSSCALAGALGPLAAVAVAFVCGIPGLQEAASEAVIALSNIDADFVWLLVADLAYGSDSLQTGNVEIPAPDLPDINELLPPLPSSRDALWVRFVGKECSISIDSCKAWSLLDRLESLN